MINWAAVGSFSERISLAWNENENNEEKFISNPYDKQVCDGFEEVRSLLVVQCDCCAWNFKSWEKRFLLK